MLEMSGFVPQISPITALLRCNTYTITYYTILSFLVIRAFSTVVEEDSWPTTAKRPKIHQVYLNLRPATVIICYIATVFLIWFMQTFLVCNTRNRYLRAADHHSAINCFPTSANAALACIDTLRQGTTVQLARLSTRGQTIRKEANR